MIFFHIQLKLILDINVSIVKIVGKKCFERTFKTTRKTKRNRKKRVLN